jgi:hypothetical protein
MKINDFKKLEEKINGQNFNQNYKTINTVMTFLSYFGHIASIFLSYFMLSNILYGVMTDNMIAVFITSVIILGGIELLKRDIFDKFSIQYLKDGGLVKSVMPLFLLSSFIIIISFYSSISGAKEFSSKSKELETNKKEILTQYRDSVALVYNDKVKLIEDEINTVKGKIEYKDKEQTEMEASQPLTKQQRNRVSDLKNEKNVLRADITKLEGDITNIKNELIEVVKSKEVELSNETNEKKEDNSKKSIMFIIISTLIELTILAGVFFNEYYKFRSYKEFREKLERDPNYQKWSLYDSILNVIYSNDGKVNDKLASNKNIIEMCKLNDIIILPKDVLDFLKLASSLKIIKVNGTSRYIAKQKDISVEILKKHFNIE